MRVHQPVQEMEQMVLLVSTLRKESMVAHQLLESYRLLLASTKLIMERRIPASTTKVKVRNTCDKAAIAGMVAELTKLERLYSPHKVPTEGDERVRGSLCDEVDVLRLGQERGCTQGSLRTAEVDVPRLGQERGCTQGSLRAAEVDVLRLGQERGHSNGSPYPAVDWDSMARVGMTRGGYGLSLPRSEALPVHACDPRPNHPPNWNQTVAQRAQFKQKLEEEWEAAVKTYNPMGDRYTPPLDQATRAPFGLIDGFRTNLGPISFPKGPVKGYVWDQDHSWVLFATPLGQRRRGARGSRR